MTEIKYYEVGGCVRDRIMGLKPKDIDYTVVAPSYEAMRDDILALGGKIFLEKPEYQTIRAKMVGADADFVLARKDGVYSDGRRPDSVEPGTIYDDLARRDFTMNAIAEDVETGEIIDPYDGRTDIYLKILRAVGDPTHRFNEDALRMLRAVRFMITKGFGLSRGITDCFNDYSLLDKLKTVSDERIREEINKCFAHDTNATLSFLSSYPGVRVVIFRGGITLEATMRKR